MERALVAASLMLLIAAGASAGTSAGREAFRHADFETALAELKPEAAKGDPLAQYYLAKMYQAGLGVKKDPRRAAALFGAAARKGNDDAQYNYGVALALGDGIEQDLVEGLKWLFIAERRNNPEARAYAEQLIEVLPRESVAKARKEAFEWHHRHSGHNRSMPSAVAEHPG